MEEILDEINERKNEKRTFSMLSFLTVVFNIVIFLFVVLQPPPIIHPNESFTMYPSKHFLFFFLTSSVFGIVMSFLSFYKKEPSTWFKWTGMVLNVMVSVFFIGILVVAVVMAVFL